MIRFLAAIAATALLSCCSKPKPTPAAVPSIALSEARAPVHTSRRPTVDPKSTEAAVELMRGFARLINRGQFDQAYMLLGPKAPSRASFDHEFASVANISSKVGDPGPQDGAAGSIYLSVPLTLSETINGRKSVRSMTAMLRRTNDVPGSTEAERHWHIERIDEAKSN